MTDVDSLLEAIEQYETQLSQVQLALISTPEGHDRDNLLSLQSDIQELIELTKESLTSAEREVGSDDEDDGFSDDDDDKDDNNDEKLFATEHVKFKAELENAESKSAIDDKSKQSASNSNNNIEDELKILEGMKCRAPHGSSWGGGTGFHNAMVSSVLIDSDKHISSINDIMVKILFINPTHEEMLPCSYFLDGACKFSDEKCHYSHGEIVQFSSLQEYREPDYSTIKVGSRVLAKAKNKIWHRSVILKVPGTNEEVYRVKFEASGNIIEVDIHNILPLHDDECDMSDSSDNDTSNDELSIHDGIMLPSNNDENPKTSLIHKSLLQMNSHEPLGKWEQYTRGIGSKLMAQMGYVVGSGLGKRSDGRIMPVEASILPAGKSLDHCMELRLNASDKDENLFSVERRIKKQQLKLEKQQKKLFNKERQLQKNDVFHFINDTLGDKRQEPDNSKPGSSTNDKTNLRSESMRDLNIANFRISEDIAKLEKELSKLKISLGKYSKDSIHYNNIAVQYNIKQNQLTYLRNKQKNIATERSHRKDKAKLSVF